MDARTANWRRHASGRTRWVGPSQQPHSEGSRIDRQTQGDVTPVTLKHVFRSSVTGRAEQSWAWWTCRTFRKLRQSNHFDASDLTESWIILMIRVLLITMCIESVDSLFGFSKGKLRIFLLNFDALLNKKLVARKKVEKNRTRNFASYNLRFLFQIATTFVSFVSFFLHQKDLCFLFALFFNLKKTKVMCQQHINGLRLHLN